MANAKPDIVIEQEMQLGFLDEIYSIPAGEKIKDCIQCGTCTGSCPVSFVMDHAPRKLWAMIRAGMRNEVLSSNTIWLCASCYSCTVRCPQEIRITDVMYALKQLSIKDKKFASDVTAPEFAKSFVAIINRYGRNHEPELLTRYFLKTNPFGMLKNAMLGLKLIQHGRFPFLPEWIKGIKQLQKIIKKAESLGEV
jgi:heterodisulfide reductase subunit C